MRTGQIRPLQLQAVKASSEHHSKGTKSRVSKRKETSCAEIVLVLGAITIFTLLSLLFIENYFSGKTTNPLIIFSKPKPRSDVSSMDQVDVNDLESQNIYEANEAVDGAITSVNAAGYVIRNPTDNDVSPLQPFTKKKGAFDIHFIHVPKCGGTSLTSILREVACHIDPSRNNDCCTNPGNTEKMAEKMV